MQEVKDEQMGKSLHYKNLTLEIALVLRFANTITYSNEYNLAIVFDPELRPKGSLGSAELVAGST
jgi:hypothetical protein